MLSLAVAPRAIGARSSTDIGMVIGTGLSRRLPRPILAPARGLPRRGPERLAHSTRPPRIRFDHVAEPQVALGRSRVRSARVTREEPVTAEVLADLGHAGALPGRDPAEAVV